MNYIYIIISVSELPKVDLSQTCITSLETLQFSNDGLWTFIDWLDTQSEPNFLNSISFEGPYNNEQMIEILATPEWKPENISTIEEETDAQSE